MSVATQSGDATAAPSPTIERPSNTIDRHAPAARAGARAIQDRMGIMGEVRLIAGALVTILIVAMVLAEITGAVDVGDGPFSGIQSDLESTGVAALGLLIVALLVLAASAIMRIMNNSGFGGR